MVRDDQHVASVRKLDDIGPVTPTSVPAVCEQLPRIFAMSQNYPNPFNPITRFTYTVPRQSPVKIEIFNIMGQRVRVLVDEKVAAGSHVVTWNGQSDARMETASGIYFCRFQAGDFCQIRKLVLLK